MEEVDKPKSHRYNNHIPQGLDVISMMEQYTERYRTLGLNIAYYRKLRGLTQEQLAEKAGIERSRVSKTEIAWVGTSLDMIYRIADALEVEPYKLLMERD